MAPTHQLGFGRGGGREGEESTCFSVRKLLPGASPRLALPRQPVHLGWCSRSAGSEDILDVSKVMNVGKCHRHLWELTVHTGSGDVPGPLEGIELWRKLASL